MKTILSAATALGLIMMGAALAQTAAPPASQSDRGVTVNGSGAAVPASSLDTSTSAPDATASPEAARTAPSAGAEAASTGAPAGSYPATTDVAPRDATAARTTARPPAVANPRNTMKTSAAPVAGKNSFTFAQARNRLEANGYSGISGLALDKDSIWRAQASKGGKQTSVALDYQGNIVETP